MKQRQLKFRAWDNKEKKWLLGYEYPNLGGFSMVGEVMLFQEWSNVINRFILQQKDRTPDDLILMQFTGLLDKNGKEIWESDLFQVANNKIYEVRWCDGEVSEHEWRGGMFVLWLNEEIFFPFDEFAMENGKVIGNIYERSLSSEENGKGERG